MTTTKERKPYPKDAKPKTGRPTKTAADTEIFNKEVSERIRFFRTKYVHAIANEAAKMLGIPQSSLSRAETAETGVKLPFLVPFIEKYDLNVKWLATGQGSHRVNPVDVTGGQLAKTQNELLKRVYALEHYISLMEANQTAFLKKIEQRSAVIDQMQDFMHNHKK